MTLTYEKDVKKEENSVVEIDRDRMTAAGPQYGPSSLGLFPRAWVGVAPARSLERSLEGRAGPSLQQSIARSVSQVCYYRVHSWHQGLHAGQPLGAQMSMSPSWSLGRQDCSWITTERNCIQGTRLLQDPKLDFEVWWACLWKHRWAYFLLSPQGSYNYS